MRRDHRLRLSALSALLVLLAAACGGPVEPEGAGGGEDAAEEETAAGGGDEPASEEEGAATPDEEAAAGGGGDIIVGTTDTVNSIDPAKVYDYYSSNILFNVGETLVGFEPGETEVSPKLAAELPEVSEDGLTYTFALREGVTFHDGSELDSEDVAFSLQRSVDINHPEGAAFLIAGIESIETPDPLTVEITLAEPNITFLSRLAYSVGTILPSDGDYTAPDALQEEGADFDEFINEDSLVGTGPYTFGEYREGESIILEANPDYWGDAPANERVLIQFFEEGSQLRLALENGEIDIAYRDLSPDDREDLEGTEGIQVIEGQGASIRYVVLDTDAAPFDRPEVRQAFAAAVERERIITDVLADAGEPLYSMIPTGFAEYQPFFEEYEEQDPLELVGGEPVDVTLTYVIDRYGDTEPSIAQVIERSLEESGAFNVELQQLEYAQFSDQAFTPENPYPAYLLAWYPDYFDADDYIEPFYATESFTGNYANPEMDELIVAEQQVDDPASEERVAIFEDIQRLAADDVPHVPLFEVVPYAFAREGISGVEETMDAVQIFRYGLISKEG